MRPHLYAILLAGCLLGLAQTLPHPQEEGEGEEQEQEEGSDGATEEGGEEDQESLDFFASFSEDPDLVGAAPVKKVAPRASVTEPRRGLAPASLGDHAAFASATVIETCFNEIYDSAPRRTVSEQQLIDCADHYTEGKIQQYLKWSISKHLAKANVYPYSGKGQQGCKPVAPPQKRTSYVVDQVRFTSNGGSKIVLERLVAKYGAALTTLKWLNPTLLQNTYKGKPIIECNDKDVAGDYVVAIVGYDEKNWIVRTGFGPTFGDNGTFLLKKDTAYCKTGLAVAIPECTKSAEDWEDPEDENVGDENAEDENAENENAEEENAKEKNAEDEDSKE